MAMYRGIDHALFRKRQLENISEYGAWLEVHPCRECVKYIFSSPENYTLHCIAQGDDEICLPCYNFNQKCQGLPDYEETALYELRQRFFKAETTEARVVAFITLEAAVRAYGDRLESDEKRKAAEVEGEREEEVSEQIKERKEGEQDAEKNKEGKVEGEKGEGERELPGNCGDATRNDDQKLDDEKFDKLTNRLVEETRKVLKALKGHSLTTIRLESRLVEQIDRRSGGRFPDCEAIYKEYPDIDKYDNDGTANSGQDGEEDNGSEYGNEGEADGKEDEDGKDAVEDLSDRLKDL